jgi:Ca-activated chloride channel homolog
MGRHSERGRRRRSAGISREPALLAAILIAVLVGSVTAVRLVGSSPDPPEEPCPGPTTTITVGADTSAVPWLSDLAKRYNAAHRQVSGTCVRAAIREMTAQQALQALQPVPFPGGSPQPDVWLPESSTTLQLVRARAENQKLLPATAAGIASTPIVVAGPVDAVRAVAGSVPTGERVRLADVLLLAQDPAGWGGARLRHEEWGQIKFSVADPDRSALGANLLVATAGAVTGTPPRAVTAKTFTAPEATAGLLRLARSTAKVAPSGQALLTSADGVPSAQDMLGSYGLITAYEQDVWRYNGTTPAVVLQATYPLGGELGADFPYVVPDTTWVTGLDRRAAADFRTWLLSAAVQDRLGSYGLRRANGTAGPDLAVAERGLDGARFAPGPIRSAEAPAAAQAVWRLLNRRVSVLALMDVSGSMADPVPGTGRSKLALAVGAARASLQIFDDADHIGLWEFSEEIDGSRDYRQLVPLGPAGGKVNGVGRRPASVVAQSNMRPRTGTGLYDSVLAAYRSAVAGYQRGYTSSVVLLTDGRNEDSTSIGLDRLITELKRTYSLARPVHIVAIGYGRDADLGALGRIAKATDGLVFNTPDPRDIGKVFLTAMSSLTN